MGWLRALLGFVLVCAQSAYAEERYGVLVPPAMYDHPYEGKKLTLYNVPLEEIQTICPNPTHQPYINGCAFWNDDRSDCRIYLRDDAITYEGREILMRHEVAHCNGWPSTHALLQRRDE